jgi:hypothetical protein
VLLDDEIPAADVARVAAQLVARHGGSVDHVYHDGVKGFAARLAPLSATGMRHDPRVAGLEPLAAPAPRSPVDAPDTPAETRPATVALSAVAAAPGPEKFRRVVAPAADRYVVVLAGSVVPAEAERTAERLLQTYGGSRDGVKADALYVQMPEDAARRLSRDASVAYVEEASTLTAEEWSRRRPDTRTLPGQGLRRVAQPTPGRYRFVLRGSVPDDQIDATVDELLRAYEGRRQGGGASDDSRVVLVEMSEPSARALSDDFRVEYVEEQAVTPRAGRQ